MISRVFKTSVASDQPLDGSVPGGDRTISDFLTIQSLTNFGAMTGGITAAWHALARLDTALSSLYVPYAFTLVFLLVSLVTSGTAFMEAGRFKWGAFFGAVFIGVINSLVLAGAVVGTGEIVRPQ